MNKQELLIRILESREKYEASLARVSDERKSMVILHGEWSVKDLIGHICFWEERVVELVTMLRAGKDPRPGEDVDLINSRALEKMSDLSLADVVEKEKAAFHGVLAIIESASEQELEAANFYPWTEGHSVAEIISDDTWGHYDEHASEVMAWVKRIA